MKQVAAPLKLDLAQYRALAAFAQFASDLDKATRDQLTRGEKLSEITKQPQYQPLAVEKQVVILYVATTGKLDDVPTPRVREFESQFYRFLETEHPEILKELGETKALTDELTKALGEAIERFRVEVFGMEPAKTAGSADAKPAEGSKSASPSPVATPAGSAPAPTETKDEQTEQAAAPASTAPAEPAEPATAATGKPAEPGKSAEPGESATPATTKPAEPAEQADTTDRGKPA